MANIILITGGQRSGKSSYAQRLAMELAASKNRLPIYLATSRVWDEEHRKRIERHKLERQENWVNIEEEKYLSNHQFIDDDVVVIDCVTLWATNFFFDNNGDVDLSFQELCKEFESFSQNNCTSFSLFLLISLFLLDLSLFFSKSISRAFYYVEIFFTFLYFSFIIHTFPSILRRFQRY